MSWVRRVAVPDVLCQIAKSGGNLCLCGFRIYPFLSVSLTSVMDDGNLLKVDATVFNTLPDLYG